jgi:lysophospholipase L1-like esterase
MNDIKQKLETEGKYWITFVGDSITSTEWVHPNWREIVEYVLKNELSKVMSDWKKPSWGIRCFNWGLDGSTSTDIVERFEEIIQLKPDLMIVMIGANDPPLGVEIPSHQKNIEKIIGLAKSKGIELVLCTNNNPWNEESSNQYRPYAESDRKISGVKLVDMFKESENFPKEKIYTFVSEADIPEENIKKGDKDFWHPNQLGNAYIAQVILKEIFGIEFDPEKYTETNTAGYKYPEY